MEKLTLSNGFRVMLEEIDRARSCSMGVWIGSGSRFETPETAGISHFIEHMLFKGTESRSAADIAGQIDEIGGTLNAYTSKEYTCVYVRSLTDHVRKAFDIIGDMLTAPRLNESDIETEKGVIKEEIAMYEDSPEDLCMDMLYEGVWDGDMLGSNILGSRATVSAMTGGSVRKHLADFYVPERMVAAFCGRFDRTRVIEDCERFFGSMKPTGNPLKAEPAAYRPCVKTCKKDFEQTQISLGLPGFSSTDEKRYAVQLLCSILGASSSSRLFQRLREDLGLVYSIEAFNMPYLGSGLAGVSMGLSPKSEKKALDETLKIMSGIADSVTEKELSRAQEQAAASLVMGFESNAARAVRMGRCELLYGEVTDEDSIIESIRSVTLEQVSEIARNLMDFNQLSLCVVGRIGKNKNYGDVVSAAKTML